MSENSSSNQKMPKLFQKRDLWIIGGIVLLAAILLAVYQINKDEGATATVTIGLSTGTQETMTLDLNKDQIIDIDTADLPVHLEIKNGRIRFINSECEDHNCENFGWLQNQGEWAACLPAGVVVRINNIA